MQPPQIQTLNEPTPSYQLTIAMGTLDGLGRHLYSNSAAVLAELIANAWDADATTVTIDTTAVEGSQIVTIQDNGCGMDIDDMNSRFLTVGYRKRESEGGVSPKYGRPYMGRKGIGKLSVFSMADTLTVMSCKQDGQPAGFEISYPQVEEHCRAHPTEPFHPRALSDEELKECPTHGTRIVLSDLTRTVDGRTEGPLRTRIARRFDVFGHPGDKGDFKVTINDRAVGYADRQDLRRCEYVWLLGGYELPKGATSEATVLRIDNTEVQAVGLDSDARIQGWIGTVRQPAELKVDGDNETLRNIIVLARRRPIQEGILDQIDFHQIFANYATGQLIADFLDSDDHHDIATSDRQRLVEDDPRVKAFKEVTARIFKKASEQWSQKRASRHVDNLTKSVPALGDWIEALPSNERPLAKRLLGAVGAAERNSKHERTALHQGVVLAFDRMRRLDDVKLLERAAQEDLDPMRLLSVLAGLQTHEEHVYGRMINDRVKAIHQLERFLDDRARENETRDFVADHPWLLNPSWERANRASAREMTFRRIAAERGIDLTEAQNANNRIDLAFLDVSGDTLIIEFKRPGLTVQIADITSQIVRYAEVMTTVLHNEAEANHHPPRTLTGQGFDSRIQLAVIVHKVKSEAGNTMTAGQVNGRLSPFQCEIFTYDQMFASAQERYAEYIAALETDPVTKVLDALENTLASGIDKTTRHTR